MRQNSTLLSGELSSKSHWDNCFIIVLTNYPINNWLLQKSIKILAESWSIVGEVEAELNSELIVFLKKNIVHK